MKHYHVKLIFLTLFTFWYCERNYAVRVGQGWLKSIKIIWRKAKRARVNYNVPHFHLFNVKKLHLSSTLSHSPTLSHTHIRTQILTHTYKFTHAHANYAHSLSLSLSLSHTHTLTRQQIHTHILLSWYDFFVFVESA